MVWSVLVGRFPPLFPGFTSSPLSPRYRSDVQAVSPRSLALSQLTLAVLSLSALEIIHDPGHGSLFIFSYWIDVDCLFFRDQPLSSERVCSAFSVLHGACRPYASVCREGDFLASIRPEVRVSSVPALQDLWALLWLLSVGMVGQFVALCFSTVSYPPVFTLVAVGSVPRDSTSRVPVRCGPHLLGGAVAINAFWICSRFVTPLGSC